MPLQWIYLFWFKGKAYRLRQTQACSTLYSQVMKLYSKLPGVEVVFIDFSARPFAYLLRALLGRTRWGTPLN